MSAGKPLPQVYGGIIPCNRVFLTTYLWKPPFNRIDDLAEGIFVECLLAASARRPLRAGHKGLILDAARLFVSVTERGAKAFYAEYGGTTDWSESDLECAAVEIAKHFENDPTVKRYTERALRSIRDQLYITERSLDEDREYEFHSGEERVEGGFGRIYDEVMLDSNEKPKDTFVRTLDYIEHLKRLPGYYTLFALKRDLTGYLRVCHCIFGDDN